MIGTRVSHYRMVRSIGAVGMGLVYLAEDERLNRKVALKFLPPAVAQDREARARLLREAQAASALDHPNVAAVYDIEEWNGQLFIAIPSLDRLCSLGEIKSPGCRLTRTWHSKRVSRGDALKHARDNEKHRAVKKVPTSVLDCPIPL
jgi:serine/threonine protein kinase